MKTKNTPKNTPYTPEQRDAVAQLVHTHKTARGRLDWPAIKADPLYSQVGLDKRSPMAVAMLASSVRRSRRNGNGVHVVHTDPVARLLELENQTRQAVAEVQRQKQELQEQLTKTEQILSYYSDRSPYNISISGNTTVPSPAVTA